MLWLFCYVYNYLTKIFYIKLYLLSLFFLANYNELYQWSVEFYPEFWGEFWDFSGIVYSLMYDEVYIFSLKC